MAVRKIRPNPWSVTGFIPSQKKDEGSCDFESRLERDYATIIEFDPTVASYSEQPITVSYRVPSGRRVDGVPDFLVHFVPQTGRPPLLVDVKYRADLFRNWRKLKPRLRAAMLRARHEGWTYKVVTEVEIVTPYLANARFLLTYRQQVNCEVSARSRILQLLALPDVNSPASLLRAHSPEKIQQLTLLPVLWHLVSIHAIAVDLTRPLTMNSSIAVAAS